MDKKPQDIQAFFLGKIDYLSGLRFQEKINSLVYSNEINQTILFLEHNNVLTYGSNEKISDEEIKQLNKENKNLSHVRTSRGGQITLHNPGQLICYPIINLKNYFDGVLDYVKFLEKSIIRLLDHYSIKSHTVNKRRGIWVNGEPNEKYVSNKNPSGEKIAAIGLKVIKYITLHGFSLNVNNDLDMFKIFTPCGMPGLEVNSIKNISNKEINLYEVAQKICISMSEILQIPIELDTEITNLGVKID